MRISNRGVRSGADRMGFGSGLVMVHGSLASFGPVRGGASSILSGLLDCGRTVMVPAFSSAFGVPRPRRLAPLARNGVEPGFRGRTSGVGRVYTPKCGEVDRDMGANVHRYPRRPRISITQATFSVEIRSARSRPLLSTSSRYERSARIRWYSSLIGASISTKSSVTLFLRTP